MLPWGDFDAVAAWGRRNQDLLAAYWNRKIDTNKSRRRVAEHLSEP